MPSGGGRRKTRPEDEGSIVPVEQTKSKKQRVGYGKTSTALAVSGEVRDMLVA